MSLKKTKRQLSAQAHLISFGPIAYRQAPKQARKAAPPPAAEIIPITQPPPSMRGIRYTPSTMREEALALA